MRGGKRTARHAIVTGAPATAADHLGERPVRPGRSSRLLTVARRSRIAVLHAARGRPSAGGQKKRITVAPQFIFTMQDVRKVHPPNKEVLKGLWLSFYPGAKIGVLGVNGSGKSTLLRIMAGVDKDIMGEAKAAEGTKIG